MVEAIAVQRPLLSIATFARRPLFVVPRGRLGRNNLSCHRRGGGVVFAAATRVGWRCWMTQTWRKVCKLSEGVLDNECPVCSCPLLYIVSSFLTWSTKKTDTHRCPCRHHRPPRRHRRRGRHRRAFVIKRKPSRQTGEMRRMRNVPCRSLPRYVLFPLLFQCNESTEPLVSDV